MTKHCVMISGYNNEQVRKIDIISALSKKIDNYNTG